MIIEWFTSSFVYSAAKDGINLALKRRRSLTPAQKLALRERWQPAFADEIHKCLTQGLRQDAIIRDVKRMDEYPSIKSGAGISSWFKLELVGQYHRGIQVALSINYLVYVETESHWRLAGSRTEIDSGAPHYLIGFIPYESIESVNWDGDEYYGYPHIYCHFEYKGQPYERLSFCEKKTLPTGHVFFTELDSAADVKLTSQKFGTSKQLWSD